MNSSKGSVLNTSGSKTKFDLIPMRKSTDMSSSQNEALGQPRLSDVSEHEHENEPLISSKINTALPNDNDVLPRSSSLSDQIPASKSENNFQPQQFNNNNSINSSQRVKFFSDYSIKRETQLNQPPTNDSRQESTMHQRFDVSHVDSPIEAKTPPPSQDDYFLDEKGLIIRPVSSKKEKPLSRDTSGLSNSSKALKVKYDKEVKELRISINLGDPNSNGSKGCMSQLRSASFYQALFVEFFGTALLVLLTTGICLPISDPSHMDVPASINGAICTGLVVASLVWSMGHVGGANINPAVTIALLVTGESNLLRALLYIPCQMLGATVGALALTELMPEHMRSSMSYRLAENWANAAATTAAASGTRINRDIAANVTVASKAIEPLTLEKIPIGLTLLHKDLTPTQGAFMECILTFILLLAIFACIDTKRKDLGGSFPLTIGFAVTVCCLFGGKFTGASMNPARSFGPALVMNNWSNHWIYWVGPISGAIVSALVYKFMQLGRHSI